MWRNCFDKIRKNRTSFLSLERYMSIIKSDLKFECWGILTDCHSSTVSLNFVWDTAPSGLRAGLNNVWLSKSDKIGSHLIIVFTRFLLEKKTYKFFLLSKLKVKMASILCFRKRYQWYLKVCRLVKLVSKPLSGRGLSNKTSIFSLEPLEQSFLWVLSTR